MKKGNKEPEAMGGGAEFMHIKAMANALRNIYSVGNNKLSAEEWLKENEYTTEVLEDVLLYQDQQREVFIHESELHKLMDQFASTGKIPICPHENTLVCCNYCNTDTCQYHPNHN